MSDREERGRQKKKSRSKRAGLVFPVGRFHRHLRERVHIPRHRLDKKNAYGYRVGSLAPVFLAGVLEYLISEITELSGDVVIHKHKKRILPRHILLAINEDEEFRQLLKGVIIAEGGVTPSIHPVLLPKPSHEKKM